MEKNRYEKAKRYGKRFGKAYRPESGKKEVGKMDIKNFVGKKIKIKYERPYEKNGVLYMGVEMDGLKQLIQIDKNLWEKNKNKLKVGHIYEIKSGKYGIYFVEEEDNKSSSSTSSITQQKIDASLTVAYKLSDVIKLLRQIQAISKDLQQKEQAMIISELCDKVVDMLTEQYSDLFLDESE
ncbi:MAG: hypothetical protein QXN68_00485 [Thermoplasmata archaeon]